MGLIPILLAIWVSVCWGGNFAASKFALLHFPPFFTIFIRYVIVAVVLLPFARRIDANLKQLSILALLMISAHFTLVFTALWMGLSITTTVIAIQMGSPFSCLLGAIFLNDKLGAWRASGMTVSFMGIVVIAGTPEVGNHELAFALAVLGAMMWAGSNIYMKTIGKLPVMPVMFWTALMSLPQTGLVTLLVESNHLELLQTAPLSAWAGIVYSALVSTIIGYGLWYWLLRTYDITQVAPFSLLVPISAFAAGILFFHEALTSQMLLGATITVIGVAIITLRRPRVVEEGLG